MPLDSIDVPAAFPDVAEVRGDIADYYYEVQRIDQELGDMLDALDAAGLLQQTLVVITSDNGMPFPRAKGSLYDLGVRMPLIAWLPEVIPGGRRVTDLVSLTDLAPTFLDMAGLAPPESMTGTSLVPQLTTSASGKIDSHTQRSLLWPGAPHAGAGESNRRRVPHACSAHRRLPVHLQLCTRQVA